MLVTFTSLLAFGVFQFSEADLMPCSSLIPQTGLSNLYFVSRQELADVCRGIQRYLECYNTEIEESLEDFDDDNRLLHKNLENLVQEMCTNGSKMQNDYFSSRDCFQTMKGKYDTCLENAELVFRQYASTLIADPENIETVTNEKECFLHGHAVGCMASEILNFCGTLQKTTYIKLVQKSKYLGKFCQPSTAEELRTMYLEYLNLDEDIKNIYEEAFEYEL